MLTQILSFLGLIIGYILASKTKEELNQGKKWFIYISTSALILLIIISFNDNIYFNYEFFISILIGMLLNYFIKRIYLFLGLISITLSNNNLVTLIIFIFGLSYGTLEYIKFKNINYKSILINLILFIVPIILLLYKHKDIYDHVLIGNAIGGILIGAFRIIKRFKEKKRTKGS